jgi:hypothetical protein
LYPEKKTSLPVESSFRAVSVQESLAQCIEGNAAMENEIIAILYLSKE